MANGASLAGSTKSVGAEGREAPIGREFESPKGGRCTSRRNPLIRGAGVGGGIIETLSSAAPDAEEGGEKALCEFARGCRCCWIGLGLCAIGPTGNVSIMEVERRKGDEVSVSNELTAPSKDMR